MFLGDLALIIFSFPEKADEESKIKNKWAIASCFKENNEIINLQEDDAFLANEQFKVMQNDIVIRRIQPQFVNYIDATEDCYIGQNLIIIRPYNQINGKYLAFILETNIKKLYNETSASVIPAIKRKDLDEFDIGELPPINKQKAIGEVWWLNKEKVKLRQKLNELETKKTEYELQLLRRK